MIMMIKEVLFLFMLLLSGASAVLRRAEEESSTSSLRGGLLSNTTSSTIISTAAQVAPRALQTTTTATFLVTDDVFVRDSRSTFNYNGVTNLGVAYGPTTNERITFLKFPISFDLQQATSISSAVLQVITSQAPTTNITVKLLECDPNTWEEGTLTWDTRPVYDNSTILVSQTILSTQDETLFEWDVTASVVAAVQTGHSAVSFVVEPLREDPLVGDITKFHSKEDTGGRGPVMEVVYVPGEDTAPPTTSPSAAPTIDYSQPDYPLLVSQDTTTGELTYVPYANEINLVQGSTANDAPVNTVPDFSNVGYKGGGVPIPFAPVKQTISPGTGDRRADIQAAIDAVAALPLDANGIRGAVLLEAGDYEVSDPGLTVYDSGVVLRGQGQGDGTGATTRLIFTSTLSDSYAITLGFTNGGLENVEPNSATYAVTDSYVPVGSKTMTISDASTMNVGDRIIIKLQPNSDWLLHMSDMGQWGWTTASYEVIWRREVTAVNGNQLTLNAPIVQPIEAVYGGAIVYKYELLYNGQAVEIENVGVENLRIESIFASDLDENHGKHAIRVQRVSNGWIRQVTAKYFWSGAVYLRRFSHAMTIEDTASLDPKGTLSGGRRYSFTVDDGDMHLFQRCYSENARHAYASGSRTSGPNVYLDSVADDTYNDVGPHERFSTGQLYDNIKTNINPLDDNDNGGEMNVQNRGSSGSGHGWAGVQIMFWNSEATRWRIHAANGAMSWAIGMVGEKGGFLSNRIPEPDGIIQSPGVHVTPRSLYYTQLQARLGANALQSSILPAQKSGTIWTELSAWAGEGLFGDAVVAWVDEQSLPATPGVPLAIGGMVRDLNLLGNNPTYTWSGISGPGLISFGDASLLETTVSLSMPGTFTLQLDVTSATISATATVDVIVEGSGITPVPSASPSATPVASPSVSPSTSPSAVPSSAPSEVTPAPSALPSAMPVASPSGTPSTPPTVSPMGVPSASPSAMPTNTPVTSSPSVSPSAVPTLDIPCNNNGICDLGESCTTCPTDCPSGEIPGATCGNGVCEAGDGENCLTCPSDCNGVQGGKKNNRYCCGDGGGEKPVSCSDSRCGAQCTTTPAPPGGSFCCGNGSCEIGEDINTCAVDCVIPTISPAPSTSPTASPPPVLLPTLAPVASCGAVGDSCTSNVQCCGNKCRGSTGNKTCK